MDMASRPPGPHRPSDWTWLPGLQMGGEGPSPSMNPGPRPRSAAPTRRPALTTIPDWIQVAFPTAIIADQYRDIITERFLKHSVNTRVLLRESVCDHWGGKEWWPSGYTQENPLSRAWTLTGCVAEHAGPQLKRRSEGCTSELQSPLPSSSSLDTLSRSTFFHGYWTFTVNLWTKMYHLSLS